MNAVAMCPTEGLHTGACAAARRERRLARATEQARAREYCVHDPAGRPIGTIAAPEARPMLGAGAPTVLLRR